MESVIYNKEFAFTPKATDDETRTGSTLLHPRRWNRTPQRTLQNMFVIRAHTRVRLVRRENIPAFPASDWSVVRIYPRFLRPIGTS
eukprot:4278324-Pyramimonas_sp.AAC.1